MPGESHRKAAELHERAAHAHRIAATHQEEGEHLSSSELSRQALEYAARAFQHSQEAHALATLKDGVKPESRAASLVADRELVCPTLGSKK
jgi:hypothetical protein